MGLKKWEEAFKPMGKPKGFKLFYFMGDSNSTKLFEKKRFLRGEWKTKFPQTPKKRNFKTNSSRKIRPIMEVSPQTPQRRAMGHCQLALRV